MKDIHITRLKIAKEAKDWFKDQGFLRLSEIAETGKDLTGVNELLSEEEQVYLLELKLSWIDSLNEEVVVEKEVVPLAEKEIEKVAAPVKEEPIKKEPQGKIWHWHPSSRQLQGYVPNEIVAAMIDRYEYNTRHIVVISESEETVTFILHTGTTGRKSVLKKNEFINREKI